MGVGVQYRAKCVVGRREPRGLLRYTADEWAAIVQASAKERMKPGAWAQQVAYEAAVRQAGGGDHDRALMERLIAELWQNRRVLTNIGGNLNQLARVANATGAVPNGAAARTVLGLVRRVVHGTDELIGRLRAELLR